MSVTIKRNTGWSGSASKIHIEVNGEKVASVMHNQCIEIELPEGEGYLNVKQLGTKSNKILVKNGDALEITHTKFFKMSFFLMMAVLLLTIFIPNFTYRIATLFIVGGLIIISTFLIKGFHLKFLTEGRNDEH